LYARCSTSKQDLESQLHALNAWAERKRVELAAKTPPEALEPQLYGDDAISGWRSDRGGITQLLADAKENRMDYVAVVELSRIGRSMGFIASTVGELSNLGVRLVLVNSGAVVDYQTIEGASLILALGTAAHLEGMLIKERNARARLKIKREHIVVGRHRLAISAAAINALRNEGRSVRAIAKEMGCSTATAFRILQRSKTAHQSDVAELPEKRQDTGAIPAGSETAFQ
jgi:DNA invertase Pin-like site-specific DNA recombinase